MPRHDPYCDRSAALGEGFPNLIGGVIGVAVGLARGSAITARRLTEQAIWMDAPRPTGHRCGCDTVHYVHICDCDPWAAHAHCGCRR
jgi:hypothetical protein